MAIGHQYRLWNRSTGEVFGAPSNAPLDDSGNWIVCLSPKRARTSALQQIAWEYHSDDEGEYLQGVWSGDSDPLNVPATHTEISIRHRELEISPVQVFGELFDCDEKSEIRMRDAITYWDLRPLEPGVFEEREINGQLMRIIIWTRGDNSLIELTREQLLGVFNEMLAQRAVRGAILYASLRRFKANSAVTIRDVSEAENWGI